MQWGWFSERNIFTVSLRYRTFWSALDCPAIKYENVSPSGTAEFTRAKLPICAAFCSGTGLISRNSQTCPTRFRISELGNQVQIFDRGFSTADKLFALGQMFNVVQSKTSPRLEIVARWGHFPISMVLRSERSRKSKLLRGQHNTCAILVCWASKSQRRTARTERTRQTG